MPPKGMCSRESLRWLNPRLQTHNLRMKYNSIFACLFVAAFGAISAIPAQAANLSWSDTAPTINNADIANYTGTTSDAGNILAGNDAGTYVAGGRGQQGQTFTTGSNANGYTLTSVTLKHVIYTAPDTTWYDLGVGWGAGNPLTVRIGQIATGTFTASVTETAVLDATFANGTVNNAGTGKFVTITLSTPITLAANTTYAFTLDSLGPFFEVDGVGTTDANYADGTAFTAPENVAIGAATTHTGDRVFHVNLDEVPAALTFMTQPQDFTGYVGDSFTLTAQAVGGNSPIDYQWEKSDNGINEWTDVDGAVSETLNFAFLNYSDRGYYRLVATNSNDNTTSEIAHIDLSYPVPEITTQPQSIAVYEGGELNLTVVASAIGIPEYQWYKGLSGDTSNPVAGGTSDMLTISNIQTSGAGDYWVRITDPAATADSLPAESTDSATANVQVLPPRAGKVVLIDFNSTVAPSGAATPADFTTAGVPELTAADPVSVSAPLPLDTPTTEVTLSGGVTVQFADDDAVGGCNGAFAVNNGSALLNDYVYLQSDREGDGPTTVTVSGITLDPGTTYTLYVFGSGDGAGQVSLFTPVNSNHITYRNTTTSSGQLAVTFTTAAEYANDPVVFTWARDASSFFAALNGLAIVPGALPAADYASWIDDYPGVGSLTGFNDDADGDGLDNGVENLLGSDPSAPNQGITVVTRNGNTITFQHPQSSSPASDVSAGYRWSTDLATFHDDGETAGGTTVAFTPAMDTPVVGTTTVTANISGTMPSKLFVVLGATKNP